MDLEVLASDILDNLEMNGILKEDYDRALAQTVVETSLDEQQAAAEADEDTNDEELFDDVEEVLKAHLGTSVSIPDEPDPDDHWAVG